MDEEESKNVTLLEAFEQFLAVEDNSSDILKEEEDITTTSLLLELLSVEKNNVENSKNREIVRLESELHTKNMMIENLKKENLEKVTYKKDLEDRPFIMTTTKIDIDIIL